MMGMERKSLIISESEKKNTAYHEAGHVLVAKLTPGADPVHKVTIIPRGRALGLTHLLPIDEKHNYSSSYLEAMLTHLLGGRAAEKVVLNEFTTGAGNDIERATEIARKMVCEWGMSEKLGPMTFGKKEEEIFLGREIAKHRDYSEKTAVEIDAEVRRIIEAAGKRAENLIKRNIDKLHALAQALLEREILDGQAIETILEGKKLKPVYKSFVAKSDKIRSDTVALKSPPPQLPEESVSKLPSKRRRPPYNRRRAWKSDKRKTESTAKESAPPPSKILITEPEKLQNPPEKYSAPKEEIAPAATLFDEPKTPTSAADKKDAKIFLSVGKKLDYPSAKKSDAADPSTKTLDKPAPSADTNASSSRSKTAKTPSHIRRRAALDRAKSKADSRAESVDSNHPPQEIKKVQ